MPFLPFAAALTGAVFLVAVLTIARRRLRRAVPATTDAADGSPLAAAPTPVDEAQVPRWRRPSVVAARFETDDTIIVRAQTPGPIESRRAPTVFEASTNATEERMRVRYDGVPLLDRPDDALGLPRADLDTGDEVLVLERDEIWTSVGTPAGVTGWVPTMVLMDGSGWVDDDPEPELQPDAGTARDDQPSLEMLLAAVAAERRAREERLLDVKSREPTPKPAAKPRARPRRASGPAARST